MNIVAILLIAIVILSPFAFILYSLITARQGYEDEDGFHYVEN
jgi:hypothetical protein